jgi:hypothetical protein
MVFFPVLAVSFLPLPACGEVCLPGSMLIHVAQTGEEAQRYFKYVPGYNAKGFQCVWKLPPVDPAFFTSPDQRPFLRDELEALAILQTKAGKRIEATSRLREGQQEHLKGRTRSASDLFTTQ